MQIWYFTLLLNTFIVVEILIPPVQPLYSYINVGYFYEGDYDDIWDIKVVNI